MKSASPLASYAAISCPEWFRRQAIRTYSWYFIFSIGSAMVDDKESSEARRHEPIETRISSRSGRRILRALDTPVSHTLSLRPFFSVPLALREKSRILRTEKS